jgi:5-methylcytosine-specific restriction endonuclease McrA
VVSRDGSCRECGSTRYLAAHRVIPRNEGGADHPANLIALCASCHAQLEADRRDSGAGAAKQGLDPAEAPT